MNPFEVLITRGRGKWTVHITAGSAFDLKAVLKPVESGPLSFERCGHAATELAESIVGSRVSFVYEGLSPHPDAA